MVIIEEGVLSFVGVKYDINDIFCDGINILKVSGEIVNDVGFFDGRKVSKLLKIILFDKSLNLIDLFFEKNYLLVFVGENDINNGKSGEFLSDGKDE